MTALAPKMPPVEDDPVLRALARAPIETDPAEISAALQAELSFATSGGGKGLTHEELVGSLCAHHGITREEWDAASHDP